MVAHRQEAGQELLRCPLIIGGDAVGPGGVTVRVDSRGYREGSGFKRVTHASLWYLYSSVGRMVCDGQVRNNDFDVNCAGYYALKDLTELRLRTEDGIIVAYWRTSSWYGNNLIRSECRYVDPS